MATDFLVNRVVDEVYLRKGISVKRKKNNNLEDEKQSSRSVATAIQLNAEENSRAFDRVFKMMELENKRISFKPRK